MRSWAGRQAEYAENRKQTSDLELSRFMTARSKFPWSCRGREDKFSSRRHTKTGFTWLWLSVTRVSWRSGNESLRTLVLRACQLITHRHNKRGGMATPAQWWIHWHAGKSRTHPDHDKLGRNKWYFKVDLKFTWKCLFYLFIFGFYFVFSSGHFAIKKWKISEWHRQISVLYLLIPPCIAFFFMWRNTK